MPQIFNYATRERPEPALEYLKQRISSAVEQRFAGDVECRAIVACLGVP
jgi:hypothetical protein